VCSSDLFADVWGPEDNGGTSENVLAHLQTWVIDRRPDVVHLNCGLHDIATEFGQTAKRVPLERYRANVDAIFRRIREETGALLIWATTTPVNEKWHHLRKEMDRFEADVDTYNRAALEIARRMGLPVDDLNAVVVRAGRDEILKDDGVHFKDAGSVILGKAVAAMIRKTAAAKARTP
jgi:isoamyl acetate esterase